MWKYELFKDEVEDWRWRLCGPDERPVMTSEETFSTRDAARRALVRARNYAGQAMLPLRYGINEALGEVFERIVKRDEEEIERRAAIAALN